MIIRNMNAKRWFYVMLLLPIAVPLLLCLCAHLYYHLSPNPGFTFGFDGDWAFYNSPSFSTRHGSVGFFNRIFDYIILPTHMFSLSIFSVFLVLSMNYAFLQYMVFCGFLIYWARNKPMKLVLKQTWKFPFWFLLIFWLGLPIIEPVSQHWKTVWFGAMATLPVLFFAYLYVGLAYLLVPKKYLTEY